MIIVGRAISKEKEVKQRNIPTMNQRRSKAITLHVPKEKSPILLSKFWIHE